MCKSSATHSCLCARAALPIPVCVEEQRYPFLSVCKSSAAHSCLCARAALPIPVCVKEQRYPFLSVCRIFLCPDSGVAASVWDFLTCAQMLRHVIEHGGCTDTVRELALEVDSGRKIPCHTRDSNPSHYCTLLFSWVL